MRKTTAEALIKSFTTPPEECVPFIIHGIDQYGNEITEEVMIPVSGCSVTTHNKFIGTPTKTPNRLN